MDARELSDDALLQLMAFGAAEDCTDDAYVDEAELIAFAEGALPQDACPRVQAHLDACGYCRALVVAYAPAPAEIVPVIPDVAAAARSVRSLRSRGRPGRAAIGFGLAAALALFTVATLEPASKSIPYEIADVRGTVQERMGTEKPATEHWRVAPRSNVRFVLRSAHAEPVGDEAAAGVFVETPQGTYRRASAEIEAERDAGVVAFRIRVTGHELMLGSGGRARVALVVAESPDAIDDLEGRVVLRDAPGVVDVVMRSIDPVR